MKKFIFLILFLNLAYPGINGLTYHSRANCVNNETISWDLLEDHRLETASRHTGVNYHSIVDSDRVTWRSAAVCWGEGRGGWNVEGWHYLWDDHGNKFGLQDNWHIKQHEVVSDCSIYDGWWDHDKDHDKFYNS